MKPLLIADIDGTFAHAVNVMAFIRPHLHPLFPTAIEELNKFCAETSALVAPISARLRVQSAEYFTNSLRAAGFTGEFHPRLAVPRSLRPFSRGADLARFMEEEKIPFEELVIADDRPRYYTPTQMTRLVRPDPAVGFDADDRVQAVKVLSNSTAMTAWTVPQKPSAHALWTRGPATAHPAGVTVRVTTRVRPIELYEGSLPWQSKINLPTGPSKGPAK